MLRRTQIAMRTLKADLILTFILALAVRIFFSQGRLLGIDIVNQSEFVNNVIHFAGFPNTRQFADPGSSFSYPPLAILLEGSFALLFNVKVVYVALWGAILSNGLLAPITYLLGTGILKSRLGAWLGSLLVILSYLDLEFVGWSGFPSVLGVLLSAVVLCLVVNYFEKQRLRYFFGYSLVFPGTLGGCGRWWGQSPTLSFPVRSISGLRLSQQYRFRISMDHFTLCLWALLLSFSRIHSLILSRISGRRH